MFRGGGGGDGGSKCADGGGAWGNKEGPTIARVWCKWLFCKFEKVIRFDTELCISLVLHCSR